jgi:hypothetical protein
MDHHNKQDALWLLLAALAASVAVLCVKITYTVRGIGHGEYLVILLVVVLSNAAAIVVSRRNPTLAVCSFCWLVLAGVVAMVALDARNEYGTFPTVANILPVVAIGSAYVCGMRKSVACIVASVLALCWIMALYGVGDTIPALASCVIGGVLVGRLRDELDRNRRRADVTEAAIDTYVKINNGG